MAERVIEIVIKGKNLTTADFAAARKELRDLEKAQGGTEQSSKSLGQAFLGAGGAAGTFRAQVATMASAFTLASILERGVSALGAFAGEALESASNLVDLRNATGVSLGRIQEWTHVAEQSGVQLENITKGAFDLGAKLAGGDGLRGAVEKLGLSWVTVKNLKPEDQLDQVLRAAERLGPSQERNAIIVEMFGAKSAIALAKIVDGYGETAGAAKKAGDAQVEALDRAGDAWAAFKRGISTGFVQAMGGAIASMQELERGSDSMTAKQKLSLFLWSQGPRDYAAKLREAGRELIANEAAEKKRHDEAVAGAERAANAHRDYVKELGEVEKAAKNVDAATRKQIIAAVELDGKTDGLTARFGLSEDVIKRVVLQHREAESAMRKEAKAVDEEVDPSIKRLTDSYIKQIEAHEKLKQTSSGPLPMMPGWTLPKAELIEGRALVSGNTLEWAKLREEQERVAASMGATLAPTVMRVGAAFAGSNETQAQAAERIRQINASAKTAALDGLASYFTSIAQIAGPNGIGSLLSALGQMFVGFKSANDWSRQLGTNQQELGGSFGSLSVAFDDNATKSQRMSAGIQAAGSISQGAINIFHAVSNATTRMGASFSGAMAGLQAGAAFGPWGAAAGAAVGFVAGLFTNKLKKEVEAANKEINKIHDSLLQQYGDMAHLEEAANRVGLSFQEAWGHQGKAGLAATKEMAEQLEQRLKAVDAANQLAISGFGAVVAGMTKPWTELGKSIDNATKKANEAGAAYQTALANGAGADELGRLKAAADEASISVLELQTRGAHFAVDGKQQLADLGVQAIGTFGAAMVAGDSYAVALGKIGPSLVSMGDSYKAMGINVEDVGLKHLILQSTVAKGNPELIAATSGLGNSMQGLAQLGMLNVDTFAAMQRTGSAMYARLQGEVGNLGGDSRDALLPMQGYLQEAAAQAALLGLPLDANTRLLIAQSKELGIWKDKGKSSQDVLIDGMRTMVDKVDQLLTKMLGFSSAITGLPNRRDIEINVTETTTRYSRNGDNGDDGVAWGGPQASGGDYWVTRPTMFLVGEAGPERATFTPNRSATVNDFGGRAASAVAAAPASTPNVYIVNDFSGARQVTESEFAQIQSRLFAGGLQVPARAITQRTR